MNKSTATVIGAGIVGMSCASYLQELGFAVTVIDRLEPGMGCSFGNAGGVVTSATLPTVHPGIFRQIPGWLLNPKGPLRLRWQHLPKALPWLIALGRNTTPNRIRHITEARVALGFTALADHQHVLQRTGQSELLVLEDGLNLYATKADFHSAQATRDAKREFGFNAPFLNIDEARELEPDLNPNLYGAEFHGGWYRVANPYHVVTALAEEFTRNGGIILQDDVRHIETQNRLVIGLTLSDGQKHPIENLAICAGAWSGLLAQQLGSKVLLESERGYHLTIAESGINLNRALTLEGQPGAISPMNTGLRVAGTDEFAGLDAAPDWRRADVLWHLAKRILPRLRALDDDVPRWMGHRPGTPDSLPVIDASPHYDNVWYGFGHGHMGLSWGPTTGRLMAGLIGKKPANITLEPYRITRF